MKLVCTAAALGITLATLPALAQLPAGPPPEPSSPPPSYVPPPSYATGTARNVEAPTTRNLIPAPANALELTVGTGYTQGFGELRGGVGLPSVATAGAGLDFSVGYRIDPHWAVLWAGQNQWLAAERSDAVYGFTSTIAGQYHFVPTHPLDPWVEVGGGYRWLWEVPAFGQTLLTHGWQLARVRAGLDFRLDDSIALGPMIGADATLFLYQDTYYFHEHIANTKVSTFVFAGVQGRFDIGGRRTPTYTVARRE